MKNETLKITYSYWDGQGHRRVATVKKGDTVKDFLQKVKKQLIPEFRELRCAWGPAPYMELIKDAYIPQSADSHVSNSAAEPAYLLHVCQFLTLRNTGALEEGPVHPSDLRGFIALHGFPCTDRALSRQEDSCQRADVSER